MTDNEIIKALESCNEPPEQCDDCPLGGEVGCQARIMESALDLINRQQAEIEELKKVVIDDYASEYDSKIRAEAIKEFEYKLLDVSHLRIPQKIYPDDIHKIKKEMVGEEK